MADGSGRALATVTPTSLIVDGLKRAGISLIATLPDKWLSDLIHAVAADPAMTLVRVTREDDGVAVCAGAYLGGRKAALVCQNAGLLLSANVLAGYAHHHQIPFLILAAYRGSHDDNYYYQMYKGRVTVPVLQAIGLPHHVVAGSSDYHLIEEGAQEAYLNRLPVVLLLRQRALLGAAASPGG
jgi:sulfopyruvate decarboxylase subunit alpha